MTTTQASKLLLLIYFSLHGIGFTGKARGLNQSSHEDFYEDDSRNKGNQPGPPELKHSNRGKINETPTSSHPTIHILPPPANVSLKALCEGSLEASWSYSDKSATGFNLTLCSKNTKVCNTSMVKKNVRKMMFPIGLVELEYELTIYAEGRISDVKVESPAVTTNAMSFPEVPLLAGLSLSGVSPVEVKATWKMNWTHQIHFAVCRQNHSVEQCQHYNVLGIHHEAFFSGLLPATTYNVKSRAQVTFGNTTCVGPEIDEEATTYSSHPAPVENLMYEITNVTHLSASWNGPMASVRIDGFVLLCACEHPYDVKHLEIQTLKSYVNVTLDLEKELSTFHCEVWAFANTQRKRNNGTKTRFSITTNGIAAPRNVSVIKRTTTSLAFAWPIDPSAKEPRIEVTSLNETGVLRSSPKYECKSDFKKHICNISNLTPGCYYEVSVQNCAEYCGVKRVIYDNTQVAAPSEVRNVMVIITNFVNVTFYWTKPKFTNGPIDGYIIEIFNNDTQSTDNYVVGGTAVSQTVDLKEEFAYFSGKIRAYNLNNFEHTTLIGPETFMNFESLGEGPFPPHPVVSSVRDQEASLSWEETIDPRYPITGYKVYVEETNISTTNTNITLNHLRPWNKYTVNVSSCINTTWCGSGRTASFITDSSAPSAPTVLAIASVGSAWMYVTWGVPEVPNGPVDGYNVSVVGRDTSRSKTTQHLSYNVTELIPGAAYNVSVSAFNYGYYEEHCGPEATLVTSTADNSSSFTSILVPVVTALAFVITFCTMGLVLVCKRSAKKKRMAESDDEQERELITMAAPIRLRHKLCPRGIFAEDDTEYAAE